MKRVISLIMMVMTLIPAMAQHDISITQMKYEISGTCPSDAKWVYILDPSQRNARIDSVQVVNGQFKISGTDAKNHFFGIGCNTKNSFAPFLNDGTPIEVDLNTLSLKGSALNTKLSGYDHEFDAINERGNALIAPLYKAQQEGKTDAEISAMFDALSPQLRVLQEELGKLTCKVISENGDNLIPAYFSKYAAGMISYEELSSLIDESKPYYNHPMSASLKSYMEAEKKKNSIIGQKFIDIEEADVKRHTTQAE